MRPSPSARQNHRQAVQNADAQAPPPDTPVSQAWGAAWASGFNPDHPDE